MPVYDYKGLMPDGGARAGIIDADSPREARIKLRAQNVLVTEIHARRLATTSAPSKGSKERHAPPPAGGGRARRPLLQFKRGPRGRKEIPTLTRQLATLLKSGIPLAQALSAMIEQTQVPDLEAAFRDVRERVT